MNVLGIETATAVCAAAVVVDGTVVAEVQLDQRNIHAEKLLTLVDEVLGRSGKTLDTLYGIAVSIGPGSFTGLRIGLSVAKGLAYARDLPLVAVPTLEALALRAEQVSPCGATELVAPMIDARRDEVYCQFFRWRGMSLSPEGDAGDLTLAEFMLRTGERTVTIIGDAHRKMGLFLKSRNDEERRKFRFVEASLSQCSAGSVALMGESFFKEGRRDDASTLEPHYIKEFFLAK